MGMQGDAGCFSDLLVGFGPVWAGDVPQVSSVLDLVVSDLLVLQPHDAVPELCLIWAQIQNPKVEPKSCSGAKWMNEPKLLEIVYTGRVG